VSANPMLQSSRTLVIPEVLCSAAEQKFGSHFGGVQQLLIFLLQELTTLDGAEMDRADQSRIEKRLRDLGYI